jgi:hypothetical protein
LGVEGATVLWFSDRPARLKFVLRRERGAKDRQARWLAALNRAPRSELGRLVLFVDNGVPVPPSPSSTPAEAVATAYAEAEAAIAALQSVVAGGGTVSAQAVEDLEALQRQAVAGD